MSEPQDDPPWRGSLTDVTDMPRGMLGANEGALLHYLCRDIYRGHGDIIDAGAFLGSSAFCMAKGLEANPHIAHKSGRIHSYDLFRVWREEGETYEYMAQQLRAIFGIDVGDDESILHIFMANLGPLARHVHVHVGDLSEARWSGRPVEILFVDIAKSVDLWKHTLRHFLPSLMPGISIIVHQDYHHPLLPWIHVVQEHLAPYFEIMEAHADDSAAFRLMERVPDRVLAKVTNYEFTLDEELATIDGAIRRFGDDSGHIALAKAVLLGRHGRYADAAGILDAVRPQVPGHGDPKLGFSFFLAGRATTRAEARVVPPPAEFDETRYLAANGDVAKAVSDGMFDSGYHHWLLAGRREGRAP